MKSGRWGLANWSALAGVEKAVTICLQRGGSYNFFSREARNADLKKKKKQNKTHKSSRF